MQKFTPQCFVFAGVLFYGSLAHAVPEFPEELQKAIPTLKCPPPCTICHSNPAGGEGTATKPFGEATIAAGAFASDGLAGAVERMSADDSAKIFIERLSSSFDPNVEGDVDVCGPTYGCGARVEPRGRVDAVAALAALAVGFVLYRGRRRKSSRRA